jgi:signal transduction histidine kinase
MSSKPKILIVDDEPRMCKSLELILSRHNYQIKTANDVKSSIDIISHEHVDLILTDIVMDDSDGFQVMDHINRHNIDTVVVMMTGYASTDTAVEALRKGAYDYIRKPFETEEVINTIENALSQRRLLAKQREAEEELRKAHVELEQEVEERTADLRKANEQLIRSERLAATGQLAASIAHEINSPLQAISVLLGSMGKQYREDAHLIENIDILKQAIGNIRDTVRSLLDLNRPGMELKQPGNINEVIRQTLTLARNLLKRNQIKVQLDLSSEIPNINLSPQQMYQMFLNLINNAIEGMIGQIEPLSGVPREESPNKEIRISSKIESDQICIRISDTGPGIPEKDLQFIFDPFFTSKKKMGLGVGLSICYGIVEEHNGSITAENDPESGAVFTIRLPLSVES